MEYRSNYNTGIHPDAKTGGRMKINVDKVKSEAELEICFSIRQRVFVEEQQVDPDDEYDGLDDTSTHFLARLAGDPAGTARWRKTSQGYKLERFAVLKAFRGRGVGAALVRKVLDDLPADAPSALPVYLNAQSAARNLYKKFGFKQEGRVFLEAGIRHYRMRLRPGPAVADTPATGIPARNRSGKSGEAR